MNTLQKDIDDLDRLIDRGAAKDEIRFQIRLVSRQVAAFQADYARLAQSHAKLEKSHAKLVAQHKKFREAQRKPSLPKGQSWVMRGIR